MARVVLILIACSALMFVVVLQTPPQFVKSALSAYVNFPDDTAAPAEKEKERAARKTRTTTGASNSRRKPEVSARPEVQRTAQTLQATTRAGDPSQHRVRPYVFSIVSDGTALYSLNSASGSVVSVLQKGEIVEPQLEINDAGQTWAFVNVAGQNISGFLRKDSLERQQLGQTTQ